MTVRQHERCRCGAASRNVARGEQGVIIVLVAVFMLGAVGAMAALSIDVVTLYTAKSEAQLVADAAALAAGRALANSGATSDQTNLLMPQAEPLANSVAIQVAQSSFVGGRFLDASKGEVVVSFADSPTNPCTALNPISNPCVTVSVQRTDLPTFFARIWGSSKVKVTASATAEAYNPTNTTGSGSNPNLPVASICVKPWLIPNIDPTNPTSTIFYPGSGAITTPGALLGWTPSQNATPPINKGLLHSLCGTCTPASAPSVTPTQAWRFYPGRPDSFPAPSSFPNCTSKAAIDYEKSIAGCVQVPLSCNQKINIDNLTPLTNSTRNTDTANAVNCLTHSTNASASGDVVSPQASPAVPFEFTAGSDNPIPNAANKDVMVSDSLITVPVIDATAGSWPPPSFPQVQIIGFLQLFVNADGTSTKAGGGPGSGSGHVQTTIVNLIGCGTSATGTPILGNGASPVAVRLISSN